MGIAKTKENIVQLLENIVKRSELIDKQKGNRILLEIDLAMEDIRDLYTEMEVLRKLASSGDAIDVESDTRRFATKTSPQENHSQAHTEVPGRDIEQQKHTVSEETEKEPPAAENDLRQSSPPKGEPPTPADISPEEKESKSGGQVTPGHKSSGTAQQTTVKEHDLPKQPPVSKPQAKQEPDTEEKQASEKTVAREPEKPVSKAEKEPSASNSIGGSMGNKQKVVGEAFEKSQNIVHERLAQMKDDQSIATRMQFKPVNNIKEAIGINEKFLFINELFNGDIKAYNQAVDQLNNFPSIHEAFEYLNKLTYEHQWDGERCAETIEKFANLVQRRYMVA